VVSGNNTPTLPLPFAARSFSFAISEKSEVNELTLTVGIAPDPAVVDELPFDLLLLLPHAANAAMATTSPHARPIRVNERFMSPPFPVGVMEDAKERGVNEVSTFRRFS
jgi:hypothetical protein